MTRGKPWKCPAPCTAASKIIGPMVHLGLLVTFPERHARLPILEGGDHIYTLQEIETLSQLKHRNIVQYYGSEIVDDNFYIYLEFVHPGSITKVIQESGGSLSEAVVQHYTRHILLGLAYLHSKGVVHRDIKGANLLVNHLGVVKLADFGMAKYLSGHPTPLSLKGSPYWMAPELLQKETGQNLAVDIWSLGCTFIEMITGKPPWGDLSGAAAMFNVLKSKVPPIPETLSAKGKDFLCRCLQINPEERATAVELLGHPFLESRLHQQISLYHLTVLDNRKLDMTSKSRDRANRATNTTVIFQRIQGANEQQTSKSESSLGRVAHPSSQSTPCHSPQHTLESTSILSPPTIG